MKSKLNFAHKLFNFKLKSKLVFFHSSWKSEKLSQNDSLKDDRSLVTDKVETLNAFFYRYEYDFKKKTYIMS